MIAATLRPTAIAAANEKSEIHIIGDSLFLFPTLLVSPFERADNAGPGNSFPELCEKIQYYNTYFAETVHSPEGVRM